MTTQSDNELICEKLLGWVKVPHRIRAYWQLPDGREHHGGIPTFETWAEAGLILDALAAQQLDYDIDGAAVGDDEYAAIARIHHRHNRSHSAKTAPLAIRCAALAYIRSMS